MTFKQLTLVLHRWLGFSSGLVVFIVGITGCTLAFRDEIEHYTKPCLFVKEQSGKTALAPSVLDSLLKKTLPGVPADSIRMSGLQYPGPGRSVIVNYNIGTKSVFRAYLDPYTGKAIAVNQPIIDFFSWVEHGHRWLWFSFQIGRPIQSSFILVFLLLMISGIILWWPKRWNKTGRKKSLTVSWRSKWRRLNYDLHNVLGFYMTWVALIIVITGLCISSPWFQGGVYWLTSGGQQAKPFKPVFSDTTNVAPIPFSVKRLDSLWFNQIRTGNQASITYFFPAAKNTALLEMVNTSPGNTYKRVFHYYDQYTLADISAQSSFYGTYEQSGTADKLRRMNIDIHMGVIGGLPTKTLAFLASLIAASLPITGFCIWWNKRNKTTKKHSNHNT